MDIQACLMAIQIAKLLDVSHGNTAPLWSKGELTIGEITYKAWIFETSESMFFFVDSAFFDNEANAEVLKKIVVYPVAGIGVLDVYGSMNSAIQHLVSINSNNQKTELE